MCEKIPLNAVDAAFQRDFLFMEGSTSRFFECG